VLDEKENLVGTTILMEGSSDQEDSVECTDLLFATGPWCNPVVEHMMGVKYHSAIVPTPRVLTQSIFFSGCGDPEVYPRPDQTAYCTGFPDPPVVVSEVPGQEEVRPESISQIIQSVRQATSSASTNNDDNNDDTMGVLSADPTLQQSCYLPTTPDNLPFMGEVSKNCFVAAGHGCWGILMGPATGEAMASLIATGKSTPQVNLQNFDPLRFTKGPLRNL
jgi:glycine/D-amino acid oxidase-like deaminating enzyme